MSSLGMCALFYSVTSPTADLNESPNHKIARSQSTGSPKIYDYMSNPRQTFKQYVLGVHAKTKRSLAEEAESGDDLSVKTWIRDGCDPNDSDSYGYTPLLNAATLGRIVVVKELVRNGADVNKVGPFGFSALHAAAQGGHADVVTYLLRNGADINAQNEDNDTPMHLALRAHKIEIVYQLLSSGGNSRVVGFNGKDCIECAKDSGFMDLATILKNYSAFNENATFNPHLTHSVSVI